MILKSVGCNSQPGSPWQGKIHQDQPLLQQRTTAATFDTTVGLLQVCFVEFCCYDWNAIWLKFEGSLQHSVFV